MLTTILKVIPACKNIYHGYRLIYIYWYLKRDLQKVRNSKQLYQKINKGIKLAIGRGFIRDNFGLFHTIFYVAYGLTYD